MSRLATYLQDHHAGATAGLELARRSAGSNEGTLYGPELAAIAQEIDEDRKTLERVMEERGVEPHMLKEGGAWVLEKLGRLKPNDSLLSYSPLSRVLELEGLIAGLSGKLALWDALRTALGEGFAGANFEQLAERARDQRTRLEDLHARASAEALGDDAAAS